MAENENPAGQGGAPKNAVHASAANGSDYTMPRLKEQAVLERLGFVVRDLEPERWSTEGLLQLSGTLRALHAKADAERYRRLPPAETGAGLLGLLGGITPKGGGS